MLRINHNGIEIQIRFDHKKYDVPYIKNKEGRCTFVSIFLSDLDGEIYGVAYCHASDNFCKSTGRKLALADAMTNFDRDLRKTIWQEYHRHCK